MDIQEYNRIMKQTSQQATETMKAGKLHGKRLVEASKALAEAPQRLAQLQKELRMLGF